MEISLATQADIPALCLLLAELFSQETEFQPNASVQSRGLARIIADPAIGHVFVARQHQKILGMVSLLYSVSTALGEQVAWLEDMVVASESQNMAIGSLLLQHALAFAKSNGCRRITLLTDLDNQAAQRFYRRHGFISSSMLPMRLILEYS